MKNKFKICTITGKNKLEMSVCESYNNDWRGKAARILAVCFMAVCMLTGCGISGEKGYTMEELDNLAKLEIYEAGSDTLLKIVEEEETLYQFNQILSEAPDMSDEWADEAAEDYETYEEKTGELKEAAEKEGETYYIVAYKYPAAKFGDKEPEKNLTLTLYKDSNIIKMVVAEESIKNISLPEEFLTFYLKISEKENEFFESLIL